MNTFLIFPKIREDYELVFPLNKLKYLPWKIFKIVAILVIISSLLFIIYLAIIDIRKGVYDILFLLFTITIPFFLIFLLFHLWITIRVLFYRNGLLIYSDGFILPAYDGINNHWIPIFISFNDILAFVVGTEEDFKNQNYRTIGFSVEYKPTQFVKYSDYHEMNYSIDEIPTRIRSLTCFLKSLNGGTIGFNNDYINNKNQAMAILVRKILRTNKIQFIEHDAVLPTKIQGESLEGIREFQRGIIDD